MSKRKHKSVTSELALGPYKPQYDPEDLDVPQYVNYTDGRDEKIQQQVDKQVRGDVPSFDAGDIPRPLTREEAEEVIRRKNLLREDIAVTRDRISKIRKRVGELTKTGDGAELSFTVDVSKKSAVRNALRKAFGIKTDSLTFEMYRMALDARHQIEKSEKDGYVAGTLEDE